MAYCDIWSQNSPVGAVRELISNFGTSKTELRLAGCSFEDGMEFNEPPLLAPINAVLHCSLLIAILAAIILKAPMGVTAIDPVAYFFE
jgi:hypothetical protein